MFTSVQQRIKTPNVKSAGAVAVHKLFKNEIHLDVMLIPILAIFYQLSSEPAVVEVRQQAVKKKRQDQS